MDTETPSPKASKGLEIPWIHADSSHNAFSRFLTYDREHTEGRHLDHYVREMGKQGLAPSYMDSSSIGGLSGERNPLVLVELSDGGLEGTVNVVQQLKKTRDYARRPVVVTGTMPINGEMDAIINAGAFGYLDRSLWSPQEFAQLVGRYTPRENRN